MFRCFPPTFTTNSTLCSRVLYVTLWGGGFKGALGTRPPAVLPPPKDSYAMTVEVSLAQEDCHADGPQPSFLWDCPASKQIACIGKKRAKRPTRPPNPPPPPFHPTTCIEHVSSRVCS